MGTLLVQLGQCGNQIGIQLWDYLRANHRYETDYLWKEPDQNAHAILVDTEPKVLKRIIDNKKMYPHFEADNILYYQSGRANNWALGYNDIVSFQKKQDLIQKRKGHNTVSIGKEMNFDKLKNQLSKGNFKPNQEEIVYFKENNKLIRDLIDYNNIAIDYNFISIFE